MSKKTQKKKCSSLFGRLTGRDLRTLVIRAGFPYHKAPHLWQWLWVVILLPFTEEDSLNDLREKYGDDLRKFYEILWRYPNSFEKLLRMLTTPLFFELLGEFGCSDDTGKSRRRVRIVADDTKSEKFGKCIEFVKKLFDNGKKRHITGHNYVLIIAVSGDTVIPLSSVMWFPKDHPAHRSKNDIVRDEISLLGRECDRRGESLGEVEFLADSAFCVQKVMKAAEAAGLRIVTKPGNRHKFEFGGELLTPDEIVGKVADRQWNYLEADHCYQRICARHHVYGDAVLVIRRRRLRNGKIVHDVLLCNKKFYNAVRIHKAYKERWEIEMCFKYYKQYLMLGKSKFRKAGSVRSHLSCVAMAGLIVALFRRQCSRKTSFRRAVRLIARELRVI